MISQGNAFFWTLYQDLPASARVQARQAYRLFRANPDHPGLRFKKLNGAYSYWSVRFGDGYRAIGRREGDTIVRFWVGTHQAFDKLFWQLEAGHFRSW